MPADADARAKEDGDDGTQDTGSQLRWVHGRCLGARFTGNAAKRLPTKE
jgi:hypothetical protein